MAGARQIGLHVGKALNHYRCYTVWMPSTRALRTSDCLSWYPIKLHMPDSSPIEELTAALGDIERALLRKADTPALANSRQPITDAATTVSQTIRAVTSLFRPPQVPTITTDYIAPPSGFTQLNLDPLRRLDSTWIDTGSLNQPTQQSQTVNPLRRVPIVTNSVAGTQPTALQRVSTGNAPTQPIPSCITHTNRPVGQHHCEPQPNYLNATLGSSTRLSHYVINRNKKTEWRNYQVHRYAVH